MIFYLDEFCYSVLVILSSYLLNLSMKNRKKKLLPNQGYIEIKVTYNNKSLCNYIQE